MDKMIVLLIVFLLNTNCAHCEETVDCIYDLELDPYENCGTLIDGKLSLSKDFLRELHFDKYGLASIFVPHRNHYYVKPNGATLTVVSFDNGPDYFKEGLVRSEVNGKIAYYDRDFKQVISPKYDSGSPFENGRAMVCKGCKMGPPDDCGHRWLTGGLYGFLNKKGQEIVPVEFTQEEILRK